MKMALKMLLLSTLCFIDQNYLIPQDGWSLGGAVFSSKHR